MRYYWNTFAYVLKELQKLWDYAVEFYTLKWGTNVSDILGFLECLMCYIKIVAFLQPGIDYMVTSMRFVIYASVGLVYRLCKGCFLVR